MNAKRNQILLKSDIFNTKKMQSNILSTFILTMATGQVPFQLNFLFSPSNWLRANVAWEGFVAAVKCEPNQKGEIRSRFNYTPSRAFLFRGDLSIIVVAHFCPCLLTAVENQIGQL